ncbi:Inward rectifier potassium channel Irk [Flavobacterium sp. WLB]|uniref:ion channel n=1 Tax=unclassified Flavobacterium TaxID=196869 RepID=UPI0006ABD049|nr:MULTISPECIES: ion channel [unclassified Flavobacterium]KOP35899.1 Inward rectifier potassium channel Irk [Flavobacterium sp. VMW]OWU88951.1 Inward rectifier potassium channel Irk [Flavobacterium sp. NLM]PUU68073.1 Inward rectifier potassium channel Irk [Flavobacterium sp. WLB]
MSLLRKINNLQTDKNSGFGTNAGSYGGRFVNKNGTPNIEKRGMNLLRRISWYHTMIDMPNWKFMLILFSFYIIINFIFAVIYYAIGVEHLDGISPSGSLLTQFGQAYFFSAQTFTTVGYGHISPTGFLTSGLSAAEALIGLLSFAIATGLFFGRFSKPTAFLKFSHNALISPYGEGKGLMIRLVPFKNTNFTDAVAKVTLGMSIEENGQRVNKFYTLNLEIDRINALSLSWTLVHPIDENSPLYNFTEEDFKNTHGEILVFITTFDDMFSNTVAARTSYTFNEIIYGAKFQIMYNRSKDNTKTILHLDKLDQFDTTNFS